MEEEFVEVEIDVKRPYFHEWLWYQWRYSRNFHEMSFEDYRNAFCVNAIAEKVWRDSPKIISAGTDGSIRVTTVNA
jgi:hypothetical protein